jgi:hypothetical protein
MNRLGERNRALRLKAAGACLLGGAAALLLALLGCAHQQIRQQGEEEPEPDRYQVRTVGDITTVANAEALQVGGVGLVVGLEGTGGDAPPGPYRTMLEDNLRKRGVEKVKELLASPNTSLVLVSAFIPAGARKGDRLDVDVTLPPGSRTTSLRGGYLKECLLYNYEFAANLAAPDSKYRNSTAALPGHPVVKAEGPLLVGFGAGDEETKLKQGRIWGGGECRIPRPFYLVLNEKQQSARMASVIADRISQSFHGNQRGLLGTEVAKAENGSVVTLNVPPQYKHNLPRFLRVVRLVSLRDGSENRPANDSTANAVPYRRRLEQDLLDPEYAVTAALRLEALGKDSIGPLKRGLASEHPLVRFSSAESLAYLGSPSCGAELARLIQEYPSLQAFSLAALASLDEGICHVKLRELLASPIAETRYGAFRALRALDEHEPAVQGEQLNNSFWLHRVAPDSPPLVHFSTTRRPEVVLFGEDSYLVPPFSFLAGEFAVTAGPDDERCTICRVSLSRGTSRRQCSLKMEDVLRTLADMGGQYPEVVELLSQAGNCRGVSSRVAVNALPQATSVHELARAGNLKNKDRDADWLGNDLLKADEEVLNARLDLGSTPTLFETAGRRQRSTVLRDEEAALRDRKPQGGQANRRR